MRPIGASLALAMSLASRASERDTEDALELLRDPKGRDARVALAEQLLGRAKVRVQTVRLALGEAAEAA
jgi:hypothetical protein